MTRSLAVLTTALVAAAVGFTAAPQRSEAAISVGIGEQSASMFTNPLFTDLGIKRARYFPSWNVALKRQERGWLDIWLAEAEKAGVEPLISFSQSLGSACPSRPCKLPTVREYTKAFKAFRKRWPQVKVVSPWNEANHRSQPTFKNPKRAAQFYNVVRSALQGLQDHRGGRDRRAQHGEVARGRSRSTRRSRASGASTTTATPTCARARPPVAPSACSRP